MQERRKSKRFRRRLTVKYGDKDLNRAGFTYDISTGGVFIVTDGAPPKNGRLHLQLFLKKDDFILLEGVVVRQRQVPAELRSVTRGGFGLRLLAPSEILLGVVKGESRSGANRFSITYETRQELREAMRSELRHGGVFVPTTTVLPRDSDALVEIGLDFADRTFEFPCRVLQVTEAKTGGIAGLGLAFVNRAQTLAALEPFAADV